MSTGKFTLRDIGLGRAADALAQGYSAGNFDGAYSGVFSPKRDTPAAKAYPEVFAAAYTLGFFSSYETYEIPGHYKIAVLRAEKQYGDDLRALGIAVDKR